MGNPNSELRTRCFERIPITMQSSQDRGEALTQTDGDDLRRFEEVITTRLQAFFELGAALMEIKAKRLYRAEFGTFEEYCRLKWNMSRIHAHRLLKATEVRNILLPIGNIQLPQNECQVRP